MSDLPPGWEWATLGEVASSVKNGIFVSRPGTEPNGVPILRISSVRSMQLSLDDLRYSEKNADELREQDTLLLPGDLLFTRYSGSREYVGVCARVPEGAGTLTYPDKLIRARVPILDSKYLAAAFASPTVRSSVEKLLRTTAGQVGISGSALKSVRIPIAPLPEQRRIVAAIDDHLSRLEAGTTSLRQAKSRTSRLTSSWLTHVLAGLDSDRQPLENFLLEKPINGRSVPTQDGGFPVLRLTAIKNGRIDLMERKGGAWSARDAQPFLVRTGDFLVSRGNGSLTLVGRGGLVHETPDAVAFPDTLIRLRIDGRRLNSSYLSTLWNSPIIRKQIESGARTTAGIYKINQAMLRNILIPVPAIEVQLSIARQFAEVARQVDRLETSITAGGKREQQLRRSLLSAAFTGRLIPQDPNDEPASILLKRIRAEQTTRPKPKRVRHAKHTDAIQETLL